MSYSTVMYCVFVCVLVVHPEGKPEIESCLLFIEDEQLLILNRNLTALHA